VSEYECAKKDDGVTEHKFLQSVQGTAVRNV